MAHFYNLNIRGSPLYHLCWQLAVGVPYTWQTIQRVAVILQTRQSVIPVTEQLISNIINLSASRNLDPIELVNLLLDLSNSYKK